MRKFVSSSLALRHPLTLAVLLAAGPALAQTQPSGAAPGTGAVGAPKVSRSISATGRTMPPPRSVGQAAPPKAASDEEMFKAQKAAEARSKAWDNKMHKTMSTICNGC